MNVLGVHASPTGAEAVLLGEVHTGPESPGSPESPESPDVPDRTDVLARHHVEVGDPTAPDAVWRAVLAAVDGVLAAGPAPRVAGLSCATPVLTMWDAETLGSPLPLAVDTDLEPWLLDLARTASHTLALLREGQYVVGPLVSYLLARASRGTYHVSDPTHLASLGSDPADLPPGALPEPLPAGGVPVDPRSFLGLDLTVTVLHADLTALDVARLAEASRTS